MDQSNTPLVPFRHRHDGWTPERQRAFLVALGKSACLTDACRVVGLSANSARRAKGRMPEFAAAWDQALARMAPLLEHAAYTRAVEGWEVPIVRGGKVVATKRLYSDRLLALLIQRAAPMSLAATPAPGSPEAVAAAKDAARLAGGSFHTRASREETNAAILKALDAIDRRARADEAVPVEDQAAGAVTGSYKEIAG